MARPAVRASAPRQSIGIDFGTTNTVIARACGGKVEAVTFAHNGKVSDIFRSALCFWQQSDARQQITHAEAGDWGIEQYLSTPHAHRFVQSFKSYVASTSFEETAIFGARYRFEDLLSVFLRRAIEHAAGALADVGEVSVVAGRPVRFVGQHPNEKLAMERLAESYRRVGIAAPRFAYEPTGAAYFFAQRLTEDMTVLVADFGGGTSDFSIVRFKLGKGGMQSQPLGASGIGIAGDRFDYRIIDNAISPLLGKGSLFRSFDKKLPVPNHYYSAFAQWHQLALLKSQGTLRELKKLASAADDASAIERLLRIVEDDLSFRLYQSVSGAKVALSSAEEAMLRFESEDISISQRISRRQFEEWIAEDLAAMDETVGQALQAAKVTASDIDRVFLTGGSAFVPAVRNIFQARFGDEKIDSGDHLQSIAYGLALIGQAEKPERWLVPCSAE